MNKNITSEKIEFYGKERTLYTITEDAHDYPDTLLACPYGPIPLYCLGNIELLKTPILAVVGTRNPSPMGGKISHAVAAAMASKGMTILSGLAVGVDTCAHEGALSVGGGKTIAVLSNAFRSRIYPKENEDLAIRILAHNGLLVTPYNDDVENFKARLIHRSMLQARMSIALALVQSGSFYPSTKGIRAAGSRHATNEAHKLRRLIIVPKPVEVDEKAYPEKYKGVRETMELEDTFTLCGSKDYDNFARLLLMRQKHLLIEAYAHKKDMKIERFSRI